jgi:thiamine-phosphate pyrophosphorylase
MTSDRRPFDLRLYAILDPEVAGGRSMTELARLLASGGATLVQWRDKKRETRVMVEEARAVHAILRSANVPLLINDRVDVALAVGAEGVHVGQEDMTATDARRLLGPRAVIGLTINTVAQAEAAPVDLIDYAGIGGVFATTSKNDAKPPIGLAGLAGITEVLRRRAPGFPVCGISGITSANAADVIAAGADGISVISALSLQGDPAAAARNLRAIVETALTKRGKR